jgi:hypothetical protein
MIHRLEPHDPTAIGALRRRAPALLALALWAASLMAAGHALAWGATGHRFIGREAMRALPAEAPAFLRDAAAIEAVGELAREPDRWKDSGRTHDADRDPAHFLDLGDDGTVLGGPALASLPETRAAYDAALRAVGADSWRAGYLPYSIVDGWQQLAKDFAYYRVEAAALAKVADQGHRAWFAIDLARRQALILRDLGVLAHYVGDGSQPMHVSIHFNGWGAGPDPEGFTLEKVHGPFEGDFVHDFVSEDAVRAVMPPFADCRCDMARFDIARWTAAYLAATNAQVVPFYRLQKAGGFVGGDARGRAFAADRLAAGAAAMRDLTVDAWRASAFGRVGWPAVSVADVEAGRTDPYDSLYGLD